MRKKLSEKERKERDRLKRELCGEGGTGYPKDRNGNVLIFNPYSKSFIGEKISFFNQEELNFIERLKKERIIKLL